MYRSGECNQCGECCKSVNITAVRDLALAQHGSLKELSLYMSYRGIRVVGEDVEKNLLFYSLAIPCQKLGPDNACAVHNTPEKPLLCHRYPMEPPGINECSYRFTSVPLAEPRPAD